MSEQEQSPLERAARALAVNNGYEPEDWREWLDDARAVLMAIRSPSPDMLFAGSRISPLDAPVILQSYQAMIDAALGGEYGKA